MVVRSGDGDKAYYLHRDHLGSVTTMSDDLGTLIAERTYSAWGEVKTYRTGTEATFLAVTDESYTGQEHLAFGLLHYNGRVYDPIIGQFLSADPLIASPFDPQNANRRSYVLNNPLKYVDPSGFVVKVVTCVTITYEDGSTKQECETSSYSDLGAAGEALGVDSIEVGYIGSGITISNLGEYGNDPYTTSIIDSAISEFATGSVGAAFVWASNEESHVEYPRTK